MQAKLKSIKQWITMLTVNIIDTNVVDCITLKESVNIDQQPKSISTILTS